MDFIRIVIMSLLAACHLAAAHPSGERHQYYTVNASKWQSHSRHENLEVLLHPRGHGAYVEKPITLSRMTPEGYFSVRDQFSMFEQSRVLGSDVKLSSLEKQANDIVMKAKTKEYEEGLTTPHLFVPSKHIFSVLQNISRSELFSYLSLMPKGGVLHAHDTALCSTEAIVGFTYTENLWACQTEGDWKIIGFRFSRTKPTEERSEPCNWELLSTVRQSKGAEPVDQHISESLSLYPTEKFEDINAAWVRFSQIFALLDGLLFYKPIWSKYYYTALEEFSADGVQYLEFRSTLPVLYDLDGTNYTAVDTVQVYKETLDDFMKTHPNFIGSRMIYAPLKGVSDEVFDEYIKICLEVREKYPTFVAGFDLVGQEELGRPLKEFVPKLLSMPEDIQFYFHAGETNWYGSSVDENLIDAILLGTKRIGHGFAVVKHPFVMEMVKARKIAIEVNPISNQVLQLVSDYRNHPGAQLFADDYPVVVSSDDPSFWRASPLSHDFYIAFLGIASAHSDLRMLKKLAMNSIEYSSLDDEQKANAMIMWQQQWDAFIERLVKGDTSAAARSFSTSKLD